MVETRTPGPQGLSNINPDTSFVSGLNDGLPGRQFMNKPGPVDVSGNVAILGLPLEQRFLIVMHKTTPKLPAEMQEEFMLLLEPEALAFIVGVLAVWGISHFYGIGLIVDIFLIAFGVVAVGLEIFRAASRFCDCLKLTREAQSIADLDAAATALADVIAMIGVATFIAIITRGMGKGRPRSGKIKPLPLPRPTGKISVKSMYEEGHKMIQWEGHPKAFVKLKEKPGGKIVLDHIKRETQPKGSGPAMLADALRVTGNRKPTEFDIPNVLKQDGIPLEQSMKKLEKMTRAAVNDLGGYVTSVTKPTSNSLIIKVAY